MDELAIKNKLEKIFREVFDDEEICINDEMTADDIEEWDSLMHIHLLIAIEKDFDVRFSTSDTMSISNVGWFIKLLKNKLS
jgi:acyl carrier protein